MDADMEDLLRSAMILAEDCPTVLVEMSIQDLVVTLFTLKEAWDVSRAKLPDTLVTRLLDYLCAMLQYVASDALEQGAQRRAERGGDN